MLSPNELEVMELLWTEHHALSKTEIIDQSPDKSWKPSTIHLLLNSLLKKEVLKVDGFKQTGKNYGRTFAPAITREEYMAKELREYLPKSSRSSPVDFVGVFAAMVSGIQFDSQTLDELQRILDEKRKMLKE